MTDFRAGTDGAIAGIPRDGGFPAVVKRFPQIYGPLMQAGDQIMRAPGVFTQSEREMIGAHVSALTGCDFCANAHYAVAEKLGVAAPADKVADPDPKFAAALALAVKVKDQSLTRADVEALMAAGYPEAAAEEIIHVVAFFGFLNRMVSAYDFLSTPEFDQAAATMLTKAYRF